MCPSRDFAGATPPMGGGGGYPGETVGGGGGGYPGGGGGVMIGGIGGGGYTPSQSTDTHWPFPVDGDNGNNEWNGLESGEYLKECLPACYLYTTVNVDKNKRWLEELLIR